MKAILAAIAFSIAIPSMSFSQGMDMSPRERIALISAIGERCGLPEMGDRGAGLANALTDTFLSLSEDGPEDFAGVVAGAFAARDGMLHVKEMAATIPCEAGLQMIALVADNDNPVEDSVFVQSCRRVVEATSCGCLGSLASQGAPGMLDRPFDQGAVASLIRKNPLFGMMAASRCGLH